MYLVSYIEYDVNDDICKDFRLFNDKEKAFELFHEWQANFEKEKKDDPTLENRFIEPYQMRYWWNDGENCLDLQVTEIDCQ